MLSLAFGNIVASSGGNSNIIKRVEALAKTNSSVYVVVDGAAFGDWVDGLIHTALQEDCVGKVFIYAPESFEYLMLKEPSIYKSVKDEVIGASYYCDSCRFLSWERYFTFLLDKWLKENYGISYSKGKLPDFFKMQRFIHHIRNSLVDIK